MDDNHGIVMMGEDETGWITGISPKTLTEKEHRAGQMDIANALAIREDILRCCRKLCVIAIAEKDEDIEGTKGRA